MFRPRDARPNILGGEGGDVGSSLAGLGDLKSTSVQKSFPGPEIHANVIHSILQNDFVKPVSSSTKLWSMILLSCFLGLFVGFQESRFGDLGFDSFWGILDNFHNQSISRTQCYVGCGETSDFVGTDSAIGIFFTFLVMDRDKRFLKDTFGTYISPELIEQMVEEQEEPKLGGDEAFHTAFFTDVQDFSTFSEQLTATDLVELLNVYLTDMTTILQNNKGTLDKYIGDAIVAFYGAPVPVKDRHTRPVKLLLRCRNVFSY